MKGDFHISSCVLSTCCPFAFFTTVGRVVKALFGVRRLSAVPFTCQFIHTEQTFCVLICLCCFIPTTNGIVRWVVIKIAVLLEGPFI